MLQVSDAELLNEPNVTSLLDGVAGRTNNFLTDPQLAVLLVPAVDVLTEGLAGDSHRVAGHDTLLNEIVHHA